MHLSSISSAVREQLAPQGVLSAAVYRTGLTNLNTPISAFSAILIGLIGQRVERKNGKTTKAYQLT
jgi:hypothetical protein